MKTFYLGYDNDSTGFLTEYPSAKEADFNSEEWCAVEAETLEEAIDKYEESFEKWQKSANIIECTCVNALQFSNCGVKCDRGE